MSTRVLGILGAVFLLAVPAFAHHSFAMFDYNKDVILVGEVKELQWTNPHIHLEDKITVYDAKAFTKPWEFVRSYRRARADNDELHENTCTESLKLAKD